MRMPSGPIAPTTLALPPDAARASSAAVRLIFSVSSASPVGPEGVRLEDFRAGAHVFGVHFLHEPRLLQVQLVVADVEEEALAVEHGAHSPVEDVDTAVGKEGSEGDRHRGK